MSKISGFLFRNASKLEDIAMLTMVITLSDAVYREVWGESLYLNALLGLQLRSSVENVIHRVECAIGGISMLYYAFARFYLRDLMEERDYKNK